ncbi:MAG: low molecular weight phosphatase family protein [Alphaproteobacteria bacterium]
MSAAAPQRRAPASVLFACTTNTVRSPMAAAILRHLHRQRVYVESVGVRAGENDAFAQAIMDEIGLDISRHRPRSFDELDDTSFDLVISLSPEAQHRAVELTRTMAIDIEYWPTFDPTAIWGSREQMIAAYRETRDSLMARIKERFPPGRSPGS